MVKSANLSFKLYMNQSYFRTIPLIQIKPRLVLSGYLNKNFL